MPRLIYDSDQDKFEIHTDIHLDGYNKVMEFKDDLKEMIPAQNRKWDSENQCWIIDAEYEEYMREILDNHFESYEEEEM